uniref:SET domain-containing protein n=1 Tax=Peronospora matthiolae TaxID=2874970 RepID=A0AAV1UG49_9STRA
MPNCSFTTFDSTLWMTAIRSIVPGDALSIDYGNFFYRPTSERQESLLDSYGFICTCEACVTMADPTRAVRCLSAICLEGIMLPCPVRNTVASNCIGLDQLRFEWRCQACGKIADAAECTRILAAEQELIENGFPQSLDEVDAVVRRSVLHERHYLLFWALDTIGCEATGPTTFQVEAESSRRELAEVWERIVAYMNVVVPTAHHEKIIYYDNLAQVQVVLGDLAAASQAYGRAHELSCQVSGANCSPTRKLQRLMEKPPQTVEELRQLYAAEAQHRQRPSNEVEDDEMSDE